MKISYYQVNAFTGDGFKGNPAGVCLLNCWPEVKVMQEIAAENNLAETAFIVENDNKYSIRWFTPLIEVDLCGHATLASGYVLLELLNKQKKEIRFESRSGELIVRKTSEGFCMDFPADKFSEIEIEPIYRKAIHQEIIHGFKGKTDFLFILENENAVKQVVPELDVIKTLDARGIIISAPGDKVDFVSRFFAPQSGIDEDPVTGSAHTTLCPYWSLSLNKKHLNAIQLSPRGGLLSCTNNGERIDIIGNATLYISGFIHI